MPKSIFDTVQFQEAVNDRDERAQQHLIDVDNTEPRESFGSNITDTDNALSDTSVIPGFVLPENYGKYAEDLPDNMLLEDFENAEDIASEYQGGWETAGKFLGRTLTTALTETLKIPGYVVGGALGLIEQDITRMTDNAYIMAIEELDESIKEQMPVWVSDEVRNGNFWDKMSSGEFWANEGADAVGFFASSFIGGTGMMKLAQIIGKGSKYAPTVIGGVQAITESAAETAGLSRSLDAYWQQRERPDGNYNIDSDTKLILGVDRDYATPEEIKELKTSAMAGAFRTNFALLAVPSIWTARAMFGSGRKAGKVYQRDKIVDAKGKNLENIKSQLDEYSKSRGIGSTFLEANKIGGGEAFQEMVQFAAENRYSSQGEGKSNGNWIEGMLEGVAEAFTTPDGQTSMALGYLLGIGPGIRQAYQTNKNKRKKASEFSNLLSKAESSYREKFKDIITLENGIEKVNVKKVLEILEDTDNKNTMLKSYLASLARGDKENASVGYAAILAESVIPFIAEEEGLDVWTAMMNDVINIHEHDYKALGFESKDALTNNIKKLVEGIKKEQESFDRKGHSKFGINKSSTIKNFKEDEDIDDIFNTFISTMNFSSMIMKSQVAELQRLEQLNKQEIAEEFGEIDRENLTDEQKESKQLKTLLQTEKRLENKIKKAKKTLDEFHDSTKHQEAFDDFYGEVRKKELAAKKVEQQVQENLQFQKDFMENLKEKGYNVDPKRITGEDNDFVKGIVALVDKEGNVWKAGRRKKDGKFEHVLLDTTNGKIRPFKIDFLRKNFPTADNILTQEEFKEWQKNKHLRVKYQSALDAINVLIESKYGGRLETAFQTQVKIEALETKLAEKLEERKKVQARKASLKRISKKVKAELEEVQNEIKETRSELNKLYKELESLELALENLFEIQAELTNMEDISSFNNVLKNRLERLRELVGEENLKKAEIKIRNAILDNKKIIRSLESHKNKLERYRDRIIKIFEQATKDIKLSDYISEANMKKLARSIGNKYDLNTELVQMLTDKDVIPALKKHAAIELFEDFNNELNKNIEEINEKIDKAAQQILKDTSHLKNIKLLDSYLKELASIKSVFRGRMYEKEMQARKDLQYARKESEYIEQNDNSDESQIYFKKENMYSTVTSMFEMYTDPKDGKRKPRLDENGKRILNKNYEQSKRWNDALDKIKISQLDNYFVAIVTADVLLDEPEYNFTQEDIPVDKNGNVLNSNEDLYVVIIDRENKKPVMIDDKVAFTGIANTSTYFFEDGSSSIRFENTAEYKNLENAWNRHEKKLQQSDSNKLSEIPEFSHKIGSSDLIATDFEDGKRKIISLYKSRYISWRKKLVDAIDKNKYAFTTLDNVSLGIPYKVGEKYNSPTEVFGTIPEIVIPLSNVQGLGSTTMNVEKGMVYGKLPNGKLVRLKNKRIDSLPEKEMNDYLQTIINFMALANLNVTNSLTHNFKFNGTKSGMNLTEILDFYVMTGGKSETWNIRFVKNKNTGNIELKVVADAYNEDGKSETYFIPVKELLKDPDKGLTPDNIVSIEDGVVAPLVRALKTKFMNVNKSRINAIKKSPDFEKKGFWLPTKWKLKGDDIVLEKTVHKGGYKKYILDKLVYTNIEKEGEMPIFVNKYAEFGNDITATPPASKPKQSADDLLEQAKSTPKKQSRFDFGDGPKKGKYDFGDTAPTEKGVSIDEINEQLQSAASGGPVLLSSPNADGSLSFSSPPGGWDFGENTPPPSNSNAPQNKNEEENTEHCENKSRRKRHSKPI